MPEKWDASTDTRVIAVKNWALSAGHQSQTEGYTDLEIAMLIQFTRTDEGAIKKFCRQVGIELVEERSEPKPKEGRRQNFINLHDPEQWVIEHEAAGPGVKRPVCPKCFLLIPPSGICCDSEDSIKPHIYESPRPRQPKMTKKSNEKVL